MGYTLIIGQAALEEIDPESNDGNLEAEYRAERVSLPDAPRDGSPTDGTNERWPSYTAWHDFAEDTRLVSLFYDEETGLLRNHPGCVLLTPDHLRQVEAAACRNKDHQGRLDWLKFWVKWALENCSKPCISNS